jgi:hypothetical protein
MTMRTATFATFMIFGLSSMFSLYFLVRFVMHRKMVSLGIMLMCAGWAITAMFLNGDVGPTAYPYIAIVGLSSVLFLGYALGSIEIREQVRQAKHRRIQAERLQRHGKE